ncbi:hypothetical protein MLAC_43440 [Mycobacterium lacus]|uniref:Uncharacterized protein n=1 Tax=Mycobacterium lacus TaxID=169765 RepID=A0A7I7NRC1_9MYCO|nr:hypothetical protein MLAC_43440 [Mycobacterium lacus]
MGWSGPVTSGGTAPGSIEGGAIARAGAAVSNASATVISKIRCTAEPLHSLAAPLPCRRACVHLRLRLRLYRRVTDAFSLDG